MDEKNIVLVGFMGCGKTLTSKKLAGTLKRKVISTDVLVEKQENKPITEIFKESGEDYFRTIEKQVIRGMADQRGVIVDCGGGVVLDEENMVNLRKNGRIFYLSASAECILENIKNRRHRPLLNVGDPKSKIGELLEARKGYYEKADITIDADYRTIDQIAGDIMKVVENE